MVMDFASSIGFIPCNLEFSPIKGPEGNIEYLLHLSQDSEKKAGSIDIDSVVAASHSTLDK